MGSCNLNNRLGLLSIKATAMASVVVAERYVSVIGFARFNVFYKFIPTTTLNGSHTPRTCALSAQACNFRKSTCAPKIRKTS